MAPVRASNVLKHLGRSARDIDRAFKGFSESARLFSSDQPRLIDEYENKWIGVYKGRVEAVADTLKALTQKIGSKNIPMSETMVRRIDREEKTLIL